MSTALVIVGLLWISSVFCFFGSAINFSLFSISPSMFSLMFGLKINDTYAWKQFGLLTFLFVLELFLIFFGIYIIRSMIKDKGVKKTIKVCGFACFLSIIAMIISFCTSIIAKTDYASELGSGAISYGVMQAISIVLFLGSVLLLYNPNEATKKAMSTNSSGSKTSSNNDVSSNDTLNSKDKNESNNNELSLSNSKTIESNNNVQKENNLNQSIIKSDNAISVDSVTNNIKDNLNKNETNKSSLISAHKEYKVISKKDQLFDGKFNPYLLENVLNSYAKQGWRIVSAFNTNIVESIESAKEEIIIILEKDVY